MVQSFYPAHVIGRYKGGSAHFWEKKGLRYSLQAFADLSTQSDISDTS
jgi:hypothetical protein